MPPGSAQPDSYYHSFVPYLSLLVAVLLAFLPVVLLLLLVLGLSVPCQNPL